MPMKTAYYTVDGEIIGQESGGQRVDYLPDALGSVVTSTDDTAATTGTSRYKPYGSDLVTSGSKAKYAWVGKTGYRTTTEDNYQMRARSYQSRTSYFTSVDPLWPYQRTYVYVESGPISRIDPSGMNFEGCPGNGGSKSPGLKGAWDRLKENMGKACRDRDKQSRIKTCYSKCGEKNVENSLKCLCESTTHQTEVKVICSEGGICNTRNFGGNDGACMGTREPSGWGPWYQPCQIRVCLENCPDNTGLGGGFAWQGALLHEMMHCCGAKHDKDNKDRKRVDVDCLEDCVRPILGWEDRKHGWPGWPKDGRFACNSGWTLLG